MEAKLHIDLEQRILEVEGSETFVREIYSDFTERIDKSTTVTHKKVDDKEKPKAEIPSTLKSKRRQTKKETLSIVKDLNLAGQGDKQSLKEFFSSYNIVSNWERDLIFVYYLENIAKIKPITSNHIFTCYRNVSVKIPGAFTQILRDTASKKGWLDTSSLDDISLTTQGINHVEYEMTKVG